MQILAGIILLGVLVAFHELGHFLFAKALGVRVLTFSIGFGPKIWGFTKGETEYRLSAIPLGGYIRMFGESLEEELTEDEKKISFMHQAIWKKSLIAFAGPLFNFILPVILLFFLLLGKEQTMAPRIGTLVKDGAADRAGLKVDDLIKSVNGQPIVSFNDLADLIAKNPGTELSFDLSRKTALGLENLNVKVKPDGKSSMNPLEKGERVGRIGIMPAIEKPVILLNDESPWAKAGLKSFDEIKKIGDKDISSANDLMLALPLAPGVLIQVERQNNDVVEKIDIHSPSINSFVGDLSIDGTVNDLEDKNQAWLKQAQEQWQKNAGLSLANGTITEITSGSVAENLGLKIKDRIVSLDGELYLSSMQLQQAFVSDAKNTHVLGIIRPNGTGFLTKVAIPSEKVDKIDMNSDGTSMLGLKIMDGFKAGEVIERNIGPLEALKKAFDQTVSIAVMTAKSLWLLVKRDVPASQIGGPIMLFDVASQAAKKGLEFYIFIMCLLSVNLGLLNLLPIPALDGGHLLLFSIEAVQRKPLTQKTRAIATQIGIAILLTLMAFALFNDLSRIFR